MTNMTEQKYNQRIGKILFYPTHDENFTEHNKIKNITFHLKDQGALEIDVKDPGEPYKSQTTFSIDSDGDTIDGEFLFQVGTKYRNCASSFNMKFNKSEGYIKINSDSGFINIQYIECKLSELDERLDNGKMAYEVINQISFNTNEITHYTINEAT